jgi:hypothetical protein
MSPFPGRSTAGSVDPPPDDAGDPLTAALTFCWWKNLRSMPGGIAFGARRAEGLPLLGGRLEMYGRLNQERIFGP